MTNEAKRLGVGRKKGGNKAQSTERKTRGHGRLAYDKKGAELRCREEWLREEVRVNKGVDSSCVVSDKKSCMQDCAALF